MYKPALLYFKFKDFSSLPSEAGSSGVLSEVQTDCNGHKWRIQLYPGGHSEAVSREPGWVGLYLRDAKGGGLFEAKFLISVKDAKGGTALEREADCEFNDKSAWGFSMFIKRSMILDAEKKHPQRWGTLP